MTRRKCAETFEFSNLRNKLKQNSPLGNMSATAFFIFGVLAAPPQRTSLETDSGETEEEERADRKGERKAERT